MQFRVLLGALVALAAAPAALADTIRVPGPGIPTIQAAIDFAWPGDVILVAPGEYTENLVLDDKTGIEIRGAGWPVLTSDSSITINLSSDLVFRGLDLAGAWVSVDKSPDVSFVGMRFHDTLSHAITASLGDRLLLSRCQFRDINGIALRIEDVDGLVVDRCRFEDIAYYAVYLLDLFAISGSDGAVFSRNRVLRATGGFSLKGNDLVFEDNRMAELTELGIYVVSGGSNSNGSFRRNRIQTSLFWGIQVSGTDGTIEKNTLVGGGIYVPAQGFRVRGNRVTNSFGQGIFVAGAAVVERNQVRGTVSEGIAVLADGSAVVGNSTTGTGGSGIALYASGCRVSKNRVAGAALNGFLLNGADNLVTENRASGSAIFDLADTAAEGVNTYDSNRFGTTMFNYVP